MVSYKSFGQNYQLSSLSYNVFFVIDLLTKVISCMDVLKVFSEI